MFAILGKFFLYDLLRTLFTDYNNMYNQESAIKKRPAIKTAKDCKLKILF